MQPDSAKTIHAIVGGRVIDPASGHDGIADVVIKNGTIAEITPKSGAQPGDPGVIDATGMFVTPGFVDLHCHLREPGREDAETVESGSAAGVRGGFTTLCCMPNTEPAIADQGMVRFVLDRALAAPGRVHPIGAITRERRGEVLAEIAEMVVAASHDSGPLSGVRR